MRIALLCLCLIVAGSVRAGPVEAPPPGFRAAQYIDSAGCVYLRQEGGWIARRDSDGMPICGFPPSLTGRGQDAAESAAETLASPEQIERDLVTRVVTSGAAIAGDGPRQPDPPGAGAGQGGKPPPDAAPPPGGDLAEDIALAMRLRDGLAVAGPATADAARLCALLGMRAAGPGRPPAADDPTRGRCAAGRDSEDLLQRRVATRPEPEDAGAEEERLQHGSDPRMAKLTPPVKAQNGRSAPGSGGGGRMMRSEAAVSKDAARTAPRSVGLPRERVTAPGQAHTPTRAQPAPRYIQIGRYGPAGVDKALSDLRGMGYRALRERSGDSAADRRVLTGPFASPADLQAALRRLQRAGYVAAFSR
ncbi:Sporulation related domain-containing protein [Paracoccus isoporae]|uniref:Sporulation related domain-containing protein n=1 Tax=Paracoccus isoporae TaxID=591205 RepID=A0A1G7APE3_9RHOB|nr:SPOR domain-containing protein [Paracoccus isoporae]SDE16681.1 Sporulation related domain-containing protein [Paracoccus isoporae]